MRTCGCELGSGPYANGFSRSQDFNASALSTIAERSAIVDADMAALACGPGVSVIDATVQHNSASNSCSNRGVENVSGESRAPRPACFRQSGSSFSVVINFHGYTILRHNLSHGQPESFYASKAGSGIKNRRPSFGSELGPGSTR